MARPDKLPEWASQDQTDPTSGQSNVIEPPEAKKDSGWSFQEIPPRQWFNWLARLTYQWIEALAEELDGIAKTVQRVELGGAFNSGQEVVCHRMGDFVTITAEGSLGHSFSDNPTSSLQAIPSDFRPTNETRQVFSISGSRVAEVTVNSSGTLAVKYIDWSGSDSSQSTTSYSFTISYVITGNVP